MDFVKDQIVELDENNENTQNAVAGGFLGIVVDEQMLQDNPELRDGGVEVGAIGVATDLLPPKENVGGEESVPAGSVENTTSRLNESAPEVIPPPIEEGKAGDTEPRKRYRKNVVLSEEDRTVGAQTFKHITCDDGCEYDLTDQEYMYEVHVSYPPHA